MRARIVKATESRARFREARTVEVHAFRPVETRSVDDRFTDVDRIRMAPLTEVESIDAWLRSDESYVEGHADAHETAREMEQWESRLRTTNGKTPAWRLGKMRSVASWLQEWLRAGSRG